MHTVSQIYFDKELYMFRSELLSIIRSLDTVYTALSASEVRMEHSDLASRQST